MHVRVCVFAAWRVCDGKQEKADEALDVQAAHKSELQLQRGELQHTLESVKSEAATAAMHAQQREAELSANLTHSRRFAPSLSQCLRSLRSLRMDASVRLHARIAMPLRPVTPHAPGPTYASLTYASSGPQQPRASPTPISRPRTTG